MKTFRVFISSTFGDFKSEREILQQIVFPKLAKKCKLFGAEFMGVDLRWGISPERSENNKTVQTCFDEIERCQRLSPKPNFLILLGQRYGWLPLPEVLSDKLFIKLSEIIINNKYLHSWYQKDRNSTLGEWLLKPRHLCEYYTDDNVIKLHNQMAEAAEILSLSTQESLLLSASATHQEIQKGVFDHIDGASDRVFAWRRIIDGLDEADGLYHDGRLESIDLLAKQLFECLKNKNYVERYTTLSDLRLPDPINEKQLTGYLKEFEKIVSDALWVMILKQIKDSTHEDEESIHRKFAIDRSKGIIGRDFQLESIRQYLSQTDPRKPYIIKAPGGMGKTSLMAQAVTNFSNESWIVRFAGASPNIGDSFSLLKSLWTDQLIEVATKTAAQSLESAYVFLEDKLRLPRFGENSQWPLYLKDALKDFKDTCSRTHEQHQNRLIAVLNEVTKQRREQLLAAMVAGFMIQREVCLKTFLSIIRDLMGGKLVLAIDALDQLQGYPDLNYLFGNLGNISGNPTLPEDVFVILSIRDEQGTSLEGLTLKAWKKVAENRLEVSQRTLTSNQMNWLIHGHAACSGNPLVLKLALEMAVRFHSWECIPTCKVDLYSLINELFKSVERPQQHGLLGSRALAYLAISRNGIPESVLLRVLASDEDIEIWFDTQIKVTQQSWSLKRGLPPILWSRLQLDLKPYLVRQDSFGSKALNYFHREFQQIALKLAKNRLSISGLYLNLARTVWHQLVGENLDPTFMIVPENFYLTKPDGWSICELPWLLEQAGHSNASKQLLSQPSFIIAKISAPGGIESISKDFERNGDSDWARLIHCHYQALLLASSPRKYIIQQAMELPEHNFARSSMQHWLNQACLEEYWIKDILTRSVPNYELAVEKSEFYFEKYDSHQILTIGGHESVKIFDQRNPTAPVKFLTHFWHDDTGQVAAIKELKELPKKGHLIARYSKGPLVVWHNGKKVAELIDVLYEELADPEVGLPLNSLIPKTETRRLSLGKSIAEKIVIENDKDILVAYDDGLVGRWTLPEFGNKDETFDGPILLRTDDSKYFQILAEDIDYSEIGERSLSVVSRIGEKTVFVFSGINMAIRIVIVSQSSSQQFYSKSQTYGSFTEPHRFLCEMDGCIAQIGSNELIKITESIETKLELSLNHDDHIEMFWFDKQHQLILLLSNDISNIHSPWKLACYTKNLDLNWIINKLPHHHPKVMVEYDLAFYLRNNEFIIRDLKTQRELSLDINKMPHSISHNDSIIIISFENGLFYNFDLKSSKFEKHVTNLKNLTILPTENDFLISHPDGYLRSWSKNSGPQDLVSPFKANFLTELPSGEVLACTSDCFMIWSSSNEIDPRIVWKSDSTHTPDIVNSATLGINGELITCGKKYLRVWNISAAPWQIEHQFGGSYDKHSFSASLSLDDGRLLIEYGIGICNRGRNIALFERTDEKWRLNTLPLPSEDGFKYHNIFTPNMINGDIVFESNSESIGEHTRLVLYNINTGDSSFLTSDDIKLDSWLHEHRTTLERNRENVIRSLLSWSNAITVGGEALKDYVKFYSDAPNLGELIALKKRLGGSLFNSRHFPATKEIAINTNAYLGGCSLKNIGVLQHCNKPIEATYLDSGSFKLWVNQLSTSGRLYLTDQHGHLRILQMMNGSEKTFIL